MEKATISCYLSICLFLPSLAFLSMVRIFSQKVSDNPAVVLKNAVLFATPVVASQHFICGKKYCPEEAYLNR